MSAGATTILRDAFGSRLEQSTLDILRAKAVRRSYPAGTTLVEQGMTGDTFYVVVEGQVAITRIEETGKERLLDMVRPGNYFGELGLLDNEPRNATCTAVTPVTVLEINAEIFERLVEESPVVAYGITRRILRTMRSHDQLAIEQLRRINEELRAAYTALQEAQADLVEKERLEHELQLAAQVQQSLLPGALPRFSGYRFAAFQEPAQLVGGDFYDVIALDDENVGVLIADVSDKGLQAAMFMGVTRTLFRSESRRSLSPAEVALSVHAGMLDVATQHDSFVTACYGVLNRPTGRFTYVRAAQERPLLARPGEPVRPLPGRGRFLGMLPALTLKEQSIILQPGDRLLLFSDGCSDAMNMAQEPYGTERLAALLGANVERSAEELVERIVTDVRRWSQGVPSFDDLTLLVVEVGNGTTRAA